MKIISFNCQGIASPHKKLDLRRLLSSALVDIIFLEETLCSAEILITLLNSWMLNWTFHALDATGRSGGIAIGVSNKTIDLRNIWGGRGYIGADIYSFSLETYLRIMNVYGPCMDRANFWRSFLGSYNLQADNIILGGNLNFSLGYRESWGHLAQVDGLTDTITNILEDHHWVDIPSARIQHTWTNN